MAFLGDVEYRLDKNGIAASVKCPLVDDWTDPVDCMENQEVIACPFRDY